MASSELAEPPCAVAPYIAAIADLRLPIYFLMLASVAVFAIDNRQPAIDNQK